MFHGLYVGCCVDSIAGLQNVVGEFAITILLSLLLEFMNDQGLQVEEEGRLTGQLRVDAEAWELEGGVKGNYHP